MKLTSQASATKYFHSMSHFATALRQGSLKELGFLQQIFGYPISKKKALAGLIILKFTESFCPQGRTHVPVEGSQTELKEMMESIWYTRLEY